MDDNCDIIVEKGGILKKKKKLKIRIKKEKPIKVEKEKPIKVEKEKPIKVKKEKPIKVKKEKKVSAKLKKIPYKVVVDRDLLNKGRDTFVPIYKQGKEKDLSEPLYEKKNKEKALTDFNNTLDDELKKYGENNDSLLTPSSFNDIYDNTISKLLLKGYVQSDFPTENSLRTNIKKYNDTIISPIIEEKSKIIIDVFNEEIDNNLQDISLDNTEYITRDDFIKAYNISYEDLVKDEQINDSNKRLIPSITVLSKDKIDGYNNTVIKPNLEQIKREAKKEIDSIKPLYYDLFINQIDAIYDVNGNRISTTLLFDDNNNFIGIDIFNLPILKYKNIYLSIDDTKSIMSDLSNPLRLEAISNYNFLKKIEYFEEYLYSDLEPYVKDLYNKYSQNIDYIIDDAINDVANDITNNVINNN